MGSLQDPDKSMEQPPPSLSRSLPPGGEWCALESSPLVFNALLQKNGVRGAYAQEMYTISPQDLEQLENNGGQVYGFIMLLNPLRRFSKAVDPESEDEPEPIEPDSVAEIFSSVVNDDDSTADAKDEKTKKSETKLYFANQVIPNACATQAVLSVIMNAPPSLDIGPVLADFKDFARDFSPIDKGLAMTNCKNLRANHNSLAERLEQESSLMQKYFQSTTVHEAPEEPLHYIAYVPVNGCIWELDGLESHPIKRRPFGVLKKKKENGGQQEQILEEEAPKSWLAVTGEVMTERIRLYPVGEERFVLFAIVKDPLVVLEEKLANERQSAAQGQMEGVIEQDSTTPLSVAGESTMKATSLPSGEQVSSDAIAELERMIEPLRRERKQEKLDIALKTADYWPAINLFLKHLVDEGKVNKQTGRLVTDQEEEALADADMRIDLITNHEAVPVGAHTEMDLVAAQEASTGVNSEIDLATSHEAVPVQAYAEMDLIAVQEVPIEAHTEMDLVSAQEVSIEARMEMELVKVQEAPIKVDTEMDLIIQEAPTEEDSKMDFVTQEVPIETKPVDTKAPKKRKKKTETKELARVEKTKFVEQARAETSKDDAAKARELVAPMRPVKPGPEDLVPTEPPPCKAKGRRRMQKSLSSLVAAQQDQPMELIQEPGSEPLKVSPVESVAEEAETGRGKKRRAALKPHASKSTPKSLAAGRGKTTQVATNRFDSVSDKKRATRQGPQLSTPLPQYSSTRNRQTIVAKAPPSSKRAKKQEPLPIDTEPFGASPDGMEIDAPVLNKGPFESSSSELSSPEEDWDDSGSEPERSSKDESRPQDTQQQRDEPSKEVQHQGDEPSKEAPQHEIELTEAQQHFIDTAEAHEIKSVDMVHHQKEIESLHKEQEGLESKEELQVERDLVDGQLLKEPEVPQVAEREPSPSHPFEHYPKDYLASRLDQDVDEKMSTEDNPPSLQKNIMRQVSR